VSGEIDQLALFMGVKVKPVPFEAHTGYGRQSLYTSPQSFGDYRRRSVGIKDTNGSANRSEG
jgi:hypothetical protein